MIGLHLLTSYVGLSVRSEIQSNVLAILHLFPFYLEISTYADCTYFA